MTTTYKNSTDVPDEVLAARLEELSEAVINRQEGWEGEFSMRIPAEVDRDADLVLTEAARRIRGREE